MHYFDIENRLSRMKWKSEVVLKNELQTSFRVLCQTFLDGKNTSMEVALPTEVIL